jgi:hypothetical protein
MNVVSGSNCTVEVKDNDDDDDDDDDAPLSDNSLNPVAASI